MPVQSWLSRQWENMQKYNYHILCCFKSQVSTQFINLDINECDTGLHYCDKNANCSDTEGSYSCNCTESYFGNGKKCQGNHSYIQHYTGNDNVFFLVAGFRPTIQATNTTNLGIYYT